MSVNVKQRLDGSVKSSTRLTGSLKNVKPLVGRLNDSCTTKILNASINKDAHSISGAVSAKEKLTGIINGKRLRIVGKLSMSTSGVTDQYDGPYEVTPLVSSQTLPTKLKVMKDDLTVSEIPFFDVSNNSGGTTVYIGKEIEIWQ